MKLLNNYWKPTPKKWRKTGDTLLAVSSLAATYNIVQNDKRLAILFLAIALIGKYLTNFFKEKNA